MASRAMMEALARHGYAVEAFSGTVLELGQEIDTAAWLTNRGAVFESSGGNTFSIDPRGLRADVPPHYRLSVNGVPVTLHRGASVLPHQPDEREGEDFLRLYENVLNRFEPDVLVTFGGDWLAREVRARARARGIKVVFALHNFNYHSREPFETVDRVIVPSEFAARHYRETIGLECAVLPYVVDMNRARANHHERRYVIAVNPSYEKGVYVLSRIADELGRQRPDIPLLVVEGRGSERTLVDCGLDLRAHGNVSLMTHTHDPRQFWSVAKICLLLSLWLENQPLVAVEALINGVPVIGSDRGGIPETLGHSGIILQIPAHITPSARVLPTAEDVAPWVAAVIRLWDDAEFYDEHQRRALEEARRWSPEELEPKYVRFFSETPRFPR